MRVFLITKSIHYFCFRRSCLKIIQIFINAKQFAYVIISLRCLAKCIQMPYFE